MTDDADFPSPIEPEQDDILEDALSHAPRPYSRLQLLLAGLLAALIAGLALYSATPTQYSARALIRIAKDAPFIAFQPDSDDRRSDRFVETQLEWIRSPVILDRVLGNPSAAACAELRESVDPLAHLQDRLLISHVGNSDLYEAKYVSASAEDAASIVNTIVTEYLAAHRSDADYNGARLIEVLGAEQQRREADLARSRERVLQLSRETHGPNPFSENATSRNEDRYQLTSDLRRKAAEVDLELALLNAEQRRLESTTPKLPDVNAQVELALQSHPPIIASQLTVDELQAQVDQLQEPTGEGGTDENDALAQLKRELSERRAALDQLKQDQRDVLRRKQAAFNAQERFEMHESLRGKIAALNVKKGVLTSRLDAAEKQLEADEGKLISLESTLAQLDREKRVFELIAARKLELETERNAPERVALMTTARLPESPDAKVTLWKLGLICGLAFLLPLVVARFWRALAE